jgi:hypothetical protein
MSIQHPSIPCDGRVSGGCWLLLFKNNCRVGYLFIFLEHTGYQYQYIKEFGVG